MSLDLFNDARGHTQAQAGLPHGLKHVRVRPAVDIDEFLGEERQDRL
jgi:hypothetical protein